MEDDLPLEHHAVVATPYRGAYVVPCGREWRGEWTVVLHHAATGRQKNIVARGETLDEAIAEALRSPTLGIGRWLAVPSATLKRFG